MTDNPQAFPCLDSSGYGLSMHDPGMTLRDWFAGQALAGLCANLGAYSKGTLATNAAIRCYAMADALLSERAKSSAP